MAENSKIEWTHHTFNPWLGCTKLSRACDHCYAEGWAKRTGQATLWSGERRRTTMANWMLPLKWNRQAKTDGRRYRVFCASLADVFDNQVPTRWRDDLWHLIEQTPHLDWLLLTKRPQNILTFLPDPRIGVRAWGNGWPNVWLGATVENKEEAHRRIPHFREVPAHVHFLSCEPLLEAIVPDLRGINWVICGGESGLGARPMHPEWARSLRDQCVRTGVPFFFKQWGEWKPESSIDGYWNGPSGKERKWAASEGIAWLNDGRICLRDFSVAEHARRVREGIAANARAIEVDRGALDDFREFVEGRRTDNPGLEWMYRVGKKRAGALLDGREWRQFPRIANAPTRLTRAGVEGCADA